MFGQPICPSCKAIVSYVNIKEIDMRVEGEPRWRGLSYACPGCDTIISIQMDPVALKTDTIAGIISKLRK